MDNEPISKLTRGAVIELIQKLGIYKIKDIDKIKDLIEAGHLAQQHTELYLLYKDAYEELEEENKHLGKEYLKLKKRIEELESAKELAKEPVPKIRRIIED